MTEQQKKSSSDTTYAEFIQNILSTRGRFSCGDEYHERHHITPRCLGGNDEEENLIDLFAREHFVAHKLLAEENPYNRKLVLAWHIMTNVKTCYQERYQVTPEEYEESRLAYRQIMIGENNPSKSEETRRKKSDAIKGEKNHNYGKPRSESTRNKISQSHKGKVLTDETRKKISESKTGKNHPNYGKHLSVEHRKKISESSKARCTEEWKTRYRGANNPTAKQIIRLSDNTIYGYMRQAADENNVSISTMYRWCHQHKDFMYYSEYLTQQNDLKMENKIDEQESNI